MNQDVNYILHHRNVNFKIANDKNIRHVHVSLYNALFMIWNRLHFPEELSINRNDIMNLSKIGNANTYTKCLKELENSGYIIYNPSYNPMIGSKITIIRCDKGTDKGTDKGGAKGTDKGGDTLYKLLNNKTIELITSNYKVVNDKIESWLNVDTNSRDNVYYSFDEFWEDYNYKKKKDDAKKAWNKVTAKEKEQIKKTVKQFRQHKPFDTYQHPLPASYLNSKRWEDELPQDKPKVPVKDRYTPEQRKLINEMNPSERLNRQTL